MSAINLIPVSLLLVPISGLVLGSFINALVWRLRQQDLVDDAPHEKDRVSTSTHAELSIVTGRSMCTRCRHLLAPMDLIPVLSWLMLRGKCRYCHESISWQYPLVEGVTAILFLLSYIYWPLGFAAGGTFSFIMWLVFLTAFIALTIYDIRWFLLPDRIVLPLIVLGLVDDIVQVVIFGAGWSLLLQAAISIGCIAGLFFVIYVISRGKWIGFGDVKLASALGLLIVNPSHAILMLFLASLSGTFITLPLLLNGRASAKTQLPFGPFLLIATALVIFFGSQLIHWYVALFYI